MIKFAFSIIIILVCMLANAQGEIKKKRVLRAMNINELNLPRARYCTVFFELKYFNEEKVL